jgi:4-hydroxy-3-methylbut-2-enyl diphosphate reductase
MKVIVAKTAGFCWGVKKAIQLVMDEVDKSEAPIFTLGPLIHNPQTVEHLRKEHMVCPVDRIDEVDEGILTIRTHGVPPSVVTEAEERGLKVLDATCPFVSKIQQHARDLVNEGYRLLIIGERNHPEVKGIQAYSKGKGTIIESIEDVEKLKPMTRVGVIIQSTQDAKKVDKIISELLSRSAEMKIFNTICNATTERQSEVRDLARVVDVMVVVGGFNSGNTSRLAAICREIGVPTYHIETSSEIKEEWFMGIETCGLTAGASTPDSSIEEVRESLEKIGGGSESFQHKNQTISKVRGGQE